MVSAPLTATATGNAVDALRARADQLARAQQYPQAEALYQQLLQQWPQDFTTLNNLGVLYWEQARWQAAKHCFTTWADLDPHAPKPLLYLARLAFNARDFAAACHHYRRIAGHHALTLADGIAYLVSAESLGLAPTQALDGFAQWPNWIAWAKEPAFAERLALLHLRAGELTKAQQCLAVLHTDKSPATTAPLAQTLSATALNTLGQQAVGPRTTLVIDDFLAPEALLALRALGLQHQNWRYTSARQEALASLGDGFVNTALLQVAQDIRSQLLAHHPRLAVSAMWCYRYLVNDTTPPAHADDGEIAVNLWLTPDPHCLAPERGGLSLWSERAPPSYFGADAAQQAALIAPIMQPSADNTEQSIGYRNNRAVVFYGRRVHQTQPYRFGTEPQARRMNITFLYS